MRASTRVRKVRRWMRGQFVRMYGCLPSPMGMIMMRDKLAEDVACKHSSKTRPLTISIIHARINNRTPGYMLACWRERRIG